MMSNSCVSPHFKKPIKNIISAKGKVNIIWPENHLENILKESCWTCFQKWSRVKFQDIYKGNADKIRSIFYTNFTLHRGLLKSFIQFDLKTVLTKKVRRFTNSIIYFYPALFVVLVENFHEYWFLVHSRGIPLP